MYHTQPHRADCLHERGLLREAHSEVDHADQQLLAVKVVLPRVVHLRAISTMAVLCSIASCQATLSGRQECKECNVCVRAVRV